MHHVHVVLDAVSGDVHDHRNAELGPRSAVPARDLDRAGVLQADRVEDARRRLRDAVLRIARSRVRGRSLVHDRAEPRDVDELGVFHALAKCARCRHDRILQAQTARRFDLEINAALGIAHTLRSAGVFLARPLVGSRCSARQGPLARKTPTLLLGCQGIAESRSEFARRAVLLGFPRRRFEQARVVEFRELRRPADHPA